LHFKSTFAYNPLSTFKHTTTSTTHFLSIVHPVNLSKVISDPTIWILGSSIPFWASQSASFRPGGRNLNLPARIKWHGKRGMQWHQLDPLVMSLLQKYPAPQFLMIHLGSNDMVTPQLTGKKLADEIKCSFLRYNALLTQTTLVWSSVLPRLYWHGVSHKEGGKIDKKRVKLNSRIRKFLLDLGGLAIDHTNISQHNTSLFRNDGTHLSESGIEVYLGNIQSAFTVFLQKRGNHYKP
jgi:hypothetical protein